MAKETHNREGKHGYETTPPHQEKYARGDDGWNLKTTACPLLSPKVSSHPGDVVAESLSGNYMHPVLSSDQSAYIHRSNTNGKKG